MHKSFIVVVSTILFSFPNISTANETRTFGQPGYNGNNGYNGTSGQKGSSTDIFADGQPQNYDLSGRDGTDGQDGTPGYHASNCQQPPRVEYNLQGANGGNGGRGGDGGNGGDGGDFRIFYNDISALKQIIINNSGGRGGRGGRGAPEGVGCSVTQSQWQVNYCIWELWSRRKDIPDSQWQSQGKQEESACTGIEQIDIQNYMPFIPSVDRNLAVQWRHMGISQVQSYQATAGVDGQPGSDGSRGKNGNYGQATLIPKQNIPTEQVSYSSSLNNLMGKTIDLTKNIWTQKQGLSSLLNPASNVPNSYTYLYSTAKFSYKIDWLISKTPAQLEIDKISLGGKINVNNLKPSLSLQLENIPGTIDYQVKNENNLYTIDIVGGFAPSRVKSFEVKKYGGDKPYELILKDKGDVRELLTNTRITIATYTKRKSTLRGSNDYRLRDTVNFEAPPQKPFKGSMVITDNEYTLNLGKNLFPWLRSRSDIKYKITVTQTTKSGAVYKQNMSVDFVIP